MSTYLTFKQTFEEFNRKLKTTEKEFEDENKGKRTKLIYWCVCGKEVSTTYYSFIKSQKLCRSCAMFLSTNGEAKEDYFKMILDFFTGMNKKLITTIQTYKTDNRIDYYCGCDETTICHIYMQVLREKMENIKNGIQEHFECIKCAGKRKRKGNTDIEKILKENSCTLKTKEILTTKEKVDYICNDCEEEHARTIETITSPNFVPCKCISINSYKEELEKLEEEFKHVKVKEIDIKDKKIISEKIKYTKWDKGKPEGYLGKSGNKYIVVYGHPSITKSFNTEKEAIKWRYENSLKNRRLKNMIRTATNEETGKKWLEVKLNGGLIMKCDESDLNIVEGSVWTARISEEKYTYYVSRRESKKKNQDYALFHRLLNPKWKNSDHVNFDGLDNRRENLRDGGECINPRNRKRYSQNNPTGFTGVTRANENKPRYRATWIDDYGVRKMKSFSIKKYGEENAKNLAIRCRDLFKKIADENHETIVNNYRQMSDYCSKNYMSLMMTYMEYRSSRIIDIKCELCETEHRDCNPKIFFDIGCIFCDKDIRDYFNDFDDPKINPPKTN